MVEKICAQQKFPHLQTPCFRAAGEFPCAAPDCIVLGMVKLLVSMTGEKVKQEELRQLFHTDCKITMFNPESEYWQRITNPEFERP